MNNGINAKRPDGFIYIPDFLDGTGISLYTQWIEDVPFEFQVARGRVMKRGYQMFGYEYVTTGRKLRPTKRFPEVLDALAARVKSACPADAALFDQCIVTKYPPGAGIGWHTDAPGFADCIAGISLGSGAELLFRKNGDSAVAYAVRVTSGSLYVMTRVARSDFQHCVKPVKELRYSLTLRHVMRLPAAACGRVDSARVEHVPGVHIPGDASVDARRGHGK